MTEQERTTNEQNHQDLRQNQPTTPPTVTNDDPEDDRQYIVHRVNVVNPETGAPEVKEHRVLLSEWAEYEKKHNL